MAREEVTRVTQPAPTTPDKPTARSPHDQSVSRMLQRLDMTLDSDLDGFPHYADTSNGVWVTTPTGDWTGGFWPGTLWLAGAASGDPRYWTHARAWAQRLRARATSQTIFRGFLFYYGAALGALLASDQEAHAIALAGAAGLLGSYNEQAGIIPLGAEAEEAHSVGVNETNIDGVSASALLLWAADQTDDRASREAGRSHAVRHIELCLRDDGSVAQSATFDARSGRCLRRYTHKGYTDESTWARAQAWGLLGFALAAGRLPDEPQLVSACERIADWWIDHIPDGLVARWDFDVPANQRAENDTSATAITAAAMLKLAALVGDPAKSKRYRSFAHATVDALTDGFLTACAAADARPAGMLTEACYDHRIGLATNSELIWGDYFLLEALAVLSDKVSPDAI
ncbi:MAG: unsaturated chondroitin disaccharide hydrolase [Solirubrobacteraceae bacterium]